MAGQTETTGASSLNLDPPNTITTFLKKGAHVFYVALIKPDSPDEDNRRREYILNIILLGSIAMLVILDACIIYYAISLGPRYQDVSPIAFSCLPFFFVGLHALSRRGWFVSASYLLIAGYFASESYAVYRYGVYLPAALLGYALTIVVAGILIDTKFGFLMTAFTTLFITPLWYLQVHGVIAFQKQDINSSDGIVFGALYAVIMIVTWLSNRETEKSLARARTSERDLQHERDSLEIKIDERTQELRKTQFEKIEEVNRFAEFGQLASGLFHDMLNIMSTLSVKMDMSNMGHDGEDNAITLENASATTRQIEQFTQAIRKQLDHRQSEESFDMVQSIEQVIQLLSYKAHREHVLIVFKNQESEELKYFGNPFAFHQIIFNLTLNGIEAHENLPGEPDKERNVTLEIGKTDDVVTLHIKDRGCGMSSDIQEKIFDPFFSTKAETRGMGIGLASVKKIVEQHLAGTITVESRTGNGSRFTIVFPAKRK